MMRRWLLVLALSTSWPALAQEQDPLAPVEDPPPVADQPAPAPPPVVATPRPAPRDWPGVFRAIREGDWLGAQTGIALLPDGPLKPVARAELYTARNSPRVEMEPLVALLGEAPELPQADAIRRLAITRGAIAPPTAVPTQRIQFLGSSPRRQRARPTQADEAADALRARLQPLVEVNDAPAAETLFQEQASLLSDEGRAEAAQRVAWIYYVTGRDADAQRVADQGRVGSGGEWAGQAAWISGLAAWRMNQCAPAAAAFRDTARLTADRELAAAALYWAARAEQACGRPHEVAPLLRVAGRLADSFYGLVARETLGMPTRLAPATVAERGAAQRINVERARQLLAIGERGLADTLLRHQARIGPPQEHAELARLAGAMGLPGTQYWLAHNGPAGARVDPALRFPTIAWVPTGGWRIDPALALAHARQESDFRTSVISPAGAVGLMQVRPGTAGDFARARGTALGNLTDPALNLEYGQSFIELVRRNGATRGQLLKVIAAYNAGPVPVERWNFIPDKADPLLWMESLPYWETRYYVPSVLRNMLVYQGLAGRDQPVLKALAEHRWPGFPEVPR